MYSFVKHRIDFSYATKLFIYLCYNIYIYEIYIYLYFIWNTFLVFQHDILNWKSSRLLFIIFLILPLGCFLLIFINFIFKFEESFKILWLIGVIKMSLSTFVIGSKFYLKEFVISLFVFLFFSEFSMSVRISQITSCNVVYLETYFLKYPVCSVRTLSAQTLDTGTSDVHSFSITVVFSCWYQ